MVRTVARAPHSVDVMQIRGTLRGFSQRFTIESGDEATLLGCRVEADPGIPMLSDEAVKHFLVQYVERMLDRVRLAAERRAPSRRPLRTAARTDAGAAADTDELTGADGAVPETPEPERAQKDTAPLVSAAQDASVDAAPPNAASDEGAPRESTPSTSSGRPAAPRSSPSRPIRARHRERPDRSQRESGSRTPVPPRQAGFPAQGGTAAAVPGPADGVADGASSGQGHRRKRRRRRRGRGSGTGAGGDPKAAGPERGGPAGPASTGS
ncbi:MAG TPA: hypothetical protein VKW09_04725 [bacterium]|nr:hypothetical protein [bacterium]